MWYKWFTTNDLFSYTHFYILVQPFVTTLTIVDYKYFYKSLWLMHPNLAKTIAKNQLNIFYSCKVREKKINIDLTFV